MILNKKNLCLSLLSVGLISAITLTSCNENEGDSDLPASEMRQQGDTMMKKYNIPHTDIVTTMQTNMMELRIALSDRNKDALVGYFSFPLNADKQFPILLDDEYAAPRIKAANGEISEQLFRDCLQNSNNLIVSLDDLKKSVKAFPHNSPADGIYQANGISVKIEESWNATGTIKDSLLTIQFNGGLPMPGVKDKRRQSEISESEYSEFWTFKLQADGKIRFVKAQFAG